MSEKHLHIISFDIPYPPNYGGVIDVFFKLKALHAEGIKIHLHCFEYGRAHAAELGKYCTNVFYYKRRSGISYFFNSHPYIAVTRSSAELIANLLRDNYPVLFEGLHCCFHLNDERLKNRIRIVRSHNIEHDYYAGLAKAEKNSFKRYYFRKEAGKLERFEPIYKNANHVIAISRGDASRLLKKYRHISVIPAFHPDEKVRVKEGKGSFVLYHGNMAIGENNEAALFLIRKVFAETAVPFVIAGNNPSGELLAEAQKHPNVRIEDNIPTEKIYEFVKDAQINILPTFQATGIKLKLLAALFNGRHCIANSPMVANTGLESLCSVKDSADEMKKEVLQLFEKEFEPAEIKRREEILLKDFSNKENARRLIELVWSQ